ncbi:MAG: peroxidase family protein, partial [Ilumatobacteraceae bacterium]
MHQRHTKVGASAAVVALVGGLMVTSLGAQAAPVVGQGFTVSAADLRYILDQIKIGEAHVVNTTPATGPCGALLGNGPDQIPNALLSFGIRTVDGSCNNLQAGQETFGAADQAFPRLTTPVFNDAEPLPFDTDGPGPEVAGQPTSYTQTTGAVADSEPRTVSNLIVDQTSDNPAAVAAAGFPVRTQGNAGIQVCGTPGAPAPPDCVPEHQTLFIPNVTTDVGLSPPFNGLFTIFGQFFDHGLDKITNGGAGTVFVPLKDDDPLVLLGPDGIVDNGDEVPPGLRFMTLTRGTIVTGPDGFRSAPNTDSPFVDQSQTYTSHSSHQVFVREYESSTGKPLATAKFLSASDGDGMANWAQIKAQASTQLGLQLIDTDVNDIPMIAADPYGNFLPGPARGMPMVMFPGNVVVEGDPAANGGLGVSMAGSLRIGTAFLNDIAHAAGPGSVTSPKTPDANLIAGGSLDPVAPGEYDDELLGIHFICGDGRCNENIALSAIHQVFHSEHDRLVDDIEATLALPENAALSVAYHATGATTFEYSERIFQAARFVTEMEYQHLVFEEFARKVQPAINPFEAFAFNQTDVNPAITAEFAHAVYRFGHSMLTESIARTNPDGSDNSIPLLDGFLNPASYYDGGTAGPIDSRAAATSIFMGMSDQVGNEIDEFVTNTLRNNLLGLPLDLPSINMARARSEGIPSLNNLRKEIFAATNDGQLAPYDNWVSWGQALKHPESLVNFVATYGTHPNIMTLDPDGAGPIVAGGLVARRIAADQIVNGTELPGPDGDILTIGDNILAPIDAGDFLFSFGTWANSGTTSITGLDDIDLWVGGLAEVTNLFGGLLGTTFNYVFENQLTNLQNGDRFYYLARTPGMNLRAQLEGNSFSELVMRNTDAYSLKADPFATADCKFHLVDITWPAPSGSFITGPGSVADFLGSECNENRLLLRQPTGRIEYRAINSVDPPGINGQSVYDGTVAVDRIWGGNDNDTIWGREGNDIIDARGGDDVVLGGEGNDIITDSAGFDVLKGGPGNDAIDGGINDDIIMGGDGNDFTNGGANFDEHFLGAGNDFAIGGQGVSVIFGDSGDDWEEGGDQPDLLIGDSSTLFFDDHNLPGHDVMIGQGGDDDSDAEGGDDIIVAGPGVEKNAGTAGFDWVIGVGDPQPQYSDLNIKILAGQPAAIETRDKFNEIEALSGWNLNDQLFGDDLAPAATAGGGFLGCDVLNQAGLDRITGLDPLVPPLNTLADTILASATTRYCLLTPGELVWGDGNILLGGAGSDRIMGRGADDILDGDKYMNVRLSVRTDVNNPATQIGTTDLMEHAAAVGGTFGAGTAGMTLQQAVFAGLVDPGNIAIVREILTPTVPAADCGGANPVNCDAALFLGPVGDYTIVHNVDGSVTVTDNVGADGIDTLRNMEQAIFCDTPSLVAGFCDVWSAPVSLTFAPTLAVATLSPLSVSFAVVRAIGA